MFTPRLLMFALALGLTGACSSFAYDLFEPSTGQPDDGLDGGDGADGGTTADCNTDLQTDEANCGACGRSCGTGTCTDGECSRGDVDVNANLKDVHSNLRRFGTYEPTWLTVEGDHAYLVGGDGDQTGNSIVAEVNLAAATPKAMLLYADLGNGPMIGSAMSRAAGKVATTTQAIAFFMSPQHNPEAEIGKVWVVGKLSSGTTTWTVVDDAWQMSTLGSDIYTEDKTKHLLKFNEQELSPSNIGNFADVTGTDGIATALVATAKGVLAGVGDSLVLFPSGGGAVKVTPLDTGSKVASISYVGGSPDLVVVLMRNASVLVVPFSSIGSTGVAQESGSVAASGSWVESIAAGLLPYGPRVVESWYVARPLSSGRGALMRRRTDVNDQEPVEYSTVQESVQDTAFAGSRVAWVSYDGTSPPAVRFHWGIR